MSHITEEYIAQVQALSGPVKRIWWETFAEVRKYFLEHNTTTIPVKEKRLYEWGERTRKAWARGSLETEQIQALQAIGFSKDKLDKRTIASPSDKVERVLELREKIEKGSATDGERIEARKLETWFRSKFAQGTLSASRASILGYQ